MATRTATISTHMGVQAVAAHNRRDPEIVSREPHIDPNGVYEVWADRPLLEVYEEQFGQSIREYDATARPAQRIGSAAEYLQRIMERRAEAEAYNAEVKKANAEIMARNAGKDKSEWEPLKRTRAAAAPVYEEIVGVYVQDGPELTEREKREILREYYDGWKQRNPNMAVVGAYYHADEPDADCHLHIDYVPVGTGYQRGMARQNSLEKALRGQGIQSAGYKETAQILWEASENTKLQEICEDRGIDVLHPQRGKHSKHRGTHEMRLQRESDRKEAALRRREAAAAAQAASAEELLSEGRKALTEAQRAVRELRGTRNDMFVFLGREYGDEAVVKFFDEFGNGTEADEAVYEAAKRGLAEAEGKAAKIAADKAASSEPQPRGPAKPQRKLSYEEQFMAILNKQQPDSPEL